MAAWAERRGYLVTIQERLFAADFKRQAQEPAIALCVSITRWAAVRSRPGRFDMIVEAGLVRGHRDFRTMRLHTLPGARPTAEMWKRVAQAETVEDRPPMRSFWRMACSIVAA